MIFRPFPRGFSPTVSLITTETNDWVLNYNGLKTIIPRNATGQDIQRLFHDSVLNLVVPGSRGDVDLHTKEVVKMNSQMRKTPDIFADAFYLDKDGEQRRKVYIGDVKTQWSGIKRKTVEESSLRLYLIQMVKTISDLGPLNNCDYELGGLEVGTDGYLSERQLDENTALVLKSMYSCLFSLLNQNKNLWDTIRVQDEKYAHSLKKKIALSHSDVGRYLDGRVNNRIETSVIKGDKMSEMMNIERKFGGLSKELLMNEDLLRKSIDKLGELSRKKLGDLDNLMALIDERRSEINEREVKVLAPRSDFKRNPSPFDKDQGNNNNNNFQNNMSSSDDLSNMSKSKKRDLKEKKVIPPNKGTERFLNSKRRIYEELKGRLRSMVASIGNFELNKVCEELELESEDDINLMRMMIKCLASNSINYMKMAAELSHRGSGNDRVLLLDGFVWDLDKLESISLEKYLGFLQYQCGMEEQRIRSSKLFPGEFVLRQTLTIWVEKTMLVNYLGLQRYITMMRQGTPNVSISNELLSVVEEVNQKLREKNEDEINANLIEKEELEINSEDIQNLMNILPDNYDYEEEKHLNSLRRRQRIKVGQG